MFKPVALLANHSPEILTKIRLYFIRVPPGDYFGLGLLIKPFYILL